MNKIDFHSFYIGLYLGFALTLVVTGYIISFKMIPVSVLERSEYYIDGVRYTIKRN